MLSITYKYVFRCGTFYNQTLTEDEKYSKIYQNYIELYQIDVIYYLHFSISTIKSITTATEKIGK